MNETNIKSFDKIIQQIYQFEELINSGLLGILGIDGGKLQGQVKDLKEKVDRYSNAINKFNPLFRERGWIVSDHSNMDVIEKCISLAENDQFGEAEEILIDHYDARHLEKIKFRFWHFQALKDRSRLIDAALAEYKAERFLSCVPLVLMIIDGFINDDHPDQKGFFASGHEVFHDDCIAAQREGLEALYKLFNQGRKATSSEEIFIPFRNGILHGRDLNYGNHHVAAKSWALLLALVDWRMKEKEPVLEKEGDKNESWAEIIEKYNAHKIEMKRKSQAISKWEKPNYEFEPLSVEKAMEYFEEDSPGYTGAMFLSYWNDKKLGKMVPLIHYRIFGKKEGKSFKDKIREMKDLYEIYDVSESRISRVNVEGPVLTEIRFTLILGVRERNYRMRLIRVDDEEEVLPSGLPGGRWKIMDGMIFPAKDI